jgi:hypothetical protein
MSLTSSSELMKGHNAVAGHPWLPAAEPGNNAANESNYLIVLRKYTRPSLFMSGTTFDLQGIDGDIK